MDHAAYRARCSEIADLLTAASRLLDRAAAAAETLPPDDALGALGDIVAPLTLSLDTWAEDYSLDYATAP